MYVVIVGCSEAGFYLARTLVASGHEVSVIERDLERFQLLTEDLGIMAVLGDGSDTDVLNQAGIGRADVVAALTGVDATNLVICQTVQHIYQTPRTMTLLKDPKNEAIFIQLGINVVVNWIQLALTALEEGIPGHPLRHLMNLKRRGLQLVCVAIPPSADIVGRRLGEIELPPDSFVSLVVNRERAALPSINYVVQAEDELIAVAASGDERVIYDILTGV